MYYKLNIPLSKTKVTIVEQNHIGKYRAFMTLLLCRYKQTKLQNRH